MKKGPGAAANGAGGAGLPRGYGMCRIPRTARFGRAVFRNSLPARMRKAFDWPRHIPVMFPYAMRRVAYPCCGVRAESVPWTTGKHRVTTPVPA